MPNLDDPHTAAAEAARRRRQDRIYTRHKRGWTETPLSYGDDAA